MHNLISLLFILSGITGLVYEVLWAKYLSLLLGNTAQAHTIVLATFLGGLALGNAILGPQADKVANHLRLYGWLELGIGVLGLLSPLSLHFLSDAYITIASQHMLPPMLALVLRFSLCMGVLLLPAMLMGGTLPMLSRFAAHSLSQLEATVSWFYFLSSAGAVLGAILAGFFSTVVKLTREAPQAVPRQKDMPLRHDACASTSSAARFAAGEGGCHENRGD